MRSTLAILATMVAAAAAATYVPGPHPDTLADWKVVGDADDNDRVHLQFWMRLQNDEWLKETLLAVSDPKSPRYGKHLSKEVLDTATAPAPEAIRAVREWIEQHNGHVEKTAAGGILSTVVPVHVAETMLSTSFQVYEHTATAAQATRVHADGYQLPSEVADHIVFATPTTRLPTVQRTRITRSPALGVVNSANVAVTPDYIKQAYNLGDAKGSNSTANVQAVGSFLGQYYKPSDLAKFFSDMVPSAVGNEPHLEGDEINENDPGTEASLDIEYIMGVAVDVQTQFWYTAGQQPGSPQNEPFLIWLEHLGNTSDHTLPTTVSVSYGDNEPTVVYDYAVRVNQEFQKLGARGVSIMFSSGDGGVGGGQPSICKKFIPTFPAGSPYVTAVGGTSPTSPETAASLSSGGFSNYWPASEAPWQKEAVANYFKVAENLPSSDLYNASGAGFPDVAAFAEDFSVIIYGFDMGVAGTSCASPTFTAIMSLVNEQRINAGKSSLGFLNPMIYSATKGFNDITEGNNPGCFSKGFYAAQGWDPVTGVGSPNFPDLVDYVMSLP